MPLSDDPRRRARQLANLRPPPAPETGNRRAVSHGGFARVARDRLDATVREVYEAIAADAPVRDGGGDLPAADSALVTLIAQAICRRDDVDANLRDFGLFDQKTGELRPAVEVEARLRREIADLLDSLGMTPRSRARLGLDVVRAFDLAQAMADDAELERREREEAGGGDG